MVNRLKWWVGSCLVLATMLCAAGCDEPTGGDKTAVIAPSPERGYAERLMPSVDALGEAWAEKGRAVVAYTRYRKYDRFPEGDASIEGFSKRADALVGKNKPCRICAAVTYEKKDAAVTATYMFADYRVLPLPEGAPLPKSEKRAWSLGKDGIAIGRIVAKSDVLASAKQKKVLTETKSVPAETSAPAAVAEDTATKTPALNAEVVEKETAANEVAEANVKEHAESVAQVETPAAPEAVASEVKSVAAVEPEPKPESDVAVVDAPIAPAQSVALAANGLMVEVEAAGEVAPDDFERIVGAIRTRLAETAKGEKAFLDEYAARRKNKAVPVKLEKKWNPGGAIYWDLLDMALGTVYREKF